MPSRRADGTAGRERGCIRARSGERPTYRLLLRPREVSRVPDRAASPYHTAPTAEGACALRKRPQEAAPATRVGTRPQTSSAYSRIVRSLENRLIRAVFTIDFRVQSATTR